MLHTYYIAKGSFLCTSAWIPLDLPCTVYPVLVCCICCVPVFYWCYIMLLLHAVYGIDCESTCLICQHCICTVTTCSCYGPNNACGANTGHVSTSLTYLVYSYRVLEGIMECTYEIWGLSQMHTSSKYCLPTAEFRGSSDAVVSVVSVHLTIVSVK